MFKFVIFYPIMDDYRLVRRVTPFVIIRSTEIKPRRSDYLPNIFCALSNAQHSRIFIFTHIKPYIDLYDTCTE